MEEAGVEGINNVGLVFGVPEGEIGVVGQLAGFLANLSCDVEIHV